MLNRTPNIGGVPKRQNMKQSKPLYFPLWSFFFFYFSVITGNFVPFIGESLNNTNSLHRFLDDNLAFCYLILRFWKLSDKPTKQLLPQQLMGWQ
jgi:hypothetical protein